jgi:hypothetical protein
MTGKLLDHRPPLPQLQRLLTTLGYRRGPFLQGLGPRVSSRQAPQPPRDLLDVLPVHLSGLGRKDRAAAPAAAAAGGIHERLLDSAAHHLCCQAMTPRRHRLCAFLGSRVPAQARAGLPQRCAQRLDAPLDVAYTWTLWHLPSTPSGNRGKPAPSSARTLFGVAWRPPSNRARASGAPSPHPCTSMTSCPVSALTRQVPIIISPSPRASDALSPPNSSSRTCSTSKRPRALPLRAGVPPTCVAAALRRAVRGTVACTGGRSAACPTRRINMLSLINSYRVDFEAWTYRRGPSDPTPGPSEGRQGAILHQRKEAHTSPQFGEME